jgi:hypothetical protein
MSKNQGKRDDQIKDSNSFAIFALICMGITIIASMINELVIWLSK